jgi:hypothetical protein
MEEAAKAPSRGEGEIFQNFFLVNYKSVARVPRVEIALSLIKNIFKNSSVIETLSY